SRSRRAIFSESVSCATRQINRYHNPFNHLSSERHQDPKQLLPNQPLRGTDAAGSKLLFEEGARLRAFGRDRQEERQGNLAGSHLAPNPFLGLQTLAIWHFSDLSGWVQS
ncbi:MAG: hypothetical protein ABSC64_21525, partial [Candidatus Korobacteraceae bacterium]